MSAPLLVVSGTGTGIGKTHVAAALLRAWVAAAEASGARAPAVAGLKPVESGVTPGAVTDVSLLEQASTFHVKRLRPPYLLERAVSPHLAAADEGRTIALEPILAYVAAAREEADGVLVELAGGLFSPLAPRLSNADVARALAPQGVLLVAPDRLGVLHDVSAASRAAEAMGLRLTGVVLVEPDARDASTGTNARELHVVCDLPVLAVVPRASVEDLARREDLQAIVRRLLRPSVPAA